MIKAIQITEKRMTSASKGGGFSFFKPYTEDDRKDFKILWPQKENWKEHELQTMIRFFGTGFIIVDENGKELRRMP